MLFLDEPTTGLDPKSRNAALAGWRAQSNAARRGAPGSFCRRPLVWFRIGGRRAHLNADTKRSAVEIVVAANRHGADQPWGVVTNRNGTINKVLPWPDGRKLSGWFAYLAEPLDKEGTL